LNGKSRKIVSFRLHEAQKKIIEERRRFNVACCGRRFGKSRMGGSLLIETTWKESAPAAWLSPTYPMLQQVWREFTELNYKIIEKVNETEKRIKIKDGGAIDFWSADNFDSIRGNKYKRVIIDEAAICRNLEDAWQQAIRPTLTDFQGDAYFFSTPKGANFFKTLFDRNEGEWKSWQLPTSSNPYIVASEIESAKNELPPNVFAQEYEARFISEIGKVFKTATITSEIPTAGLKYSIGTDLAYSKSTQSDYSVAVVMGKDSGGHYYIVHVERWQSEIGQTVERLRAIQNKYQVPIVVESNGVQKAVADMVQNAGLRITRTNPTADKLTRALSLVMGWNGGKVSVLNSPWTLPFCNELENFTGNGKDHDDQVDAAVNAFNLLSKQGLIEML